MPIKPNTSWGGDFAYAYARATRAHAPTPTRDVGFSESEKDIPSNPTVSVLSEASVGEQASTVCQSGFSLSQRVKQAQQGHNAHTRAGAPASVSNAHAPTRVDNVAHAHVHAREACWVEQAIGDESIAKMARSFGKVSAMLDELWLRQTLQKVQDTYGNVPAVTVQAALHSAFDYCARRLPVPYGQKGFVKFPREFARQMVILELRRHAIG